MDTICVGLPGSSKNPTAQTTSAELSSNATDEESESEVDSEDEEDEVQSSSDSSSSSGESPSCPICLLKFKGQALGFPDACEHPFCLDCILEWSKNVKTCPNDRRQFENILVRLDLEGKVVRKIPVAAPAKVAEEVSVFEITLCQVCRVGDREDMMLLCDQCDNGYHMDCLNPPLVEIPMDDWFCPRCHGTQRATTRAVRRPATLTMRVRQTVERNRRVALQESSNRRKATTTPKRKTRKTTKRRTTSASKKGGTTKRKRKTTTTRRKKARRVKRKGKKKKTPAVPSPRKRLATALGIQDKFSLPVAPPSQLSLFGDSNALLDGNESEEDEAVNKLLSPKKQPASLIARLAESRKAQKSIFSFGPLARVGQPKPVEPRPSVASSSSANPDLLGSILSAQEQLVSFGKPAETVARQQKRRSDRVLGAILASQATLSRLDEDIKQFEMSAKVRTCGVRQDGSSSSSNHQESSSASSQPSGSQINGQGSGLSSSGSNGIAGNGCGGSGEDPNENKKRKKADPEDKNDEEDVDLYSDIESNEEEEANPSELNSKVDVEEEGEDHPLDEDDDKGLVIDDAPNILDDSAGHSSESPSKQQNSSDSSSPGVVQSIEPAEEPKDQDPVPAAVPTPAVPKSQHGGLPAAAAALSLGPKGVVVSRPQVRPRPAATATSMMDDIVTASLVSSIASALKETLTSALLAQSQPEDSLFSKEEEESLPPPTYSSESRNESQPAPPPAVKVEAVQPDGKAVERKRKMNEIFGSDEDGDANDLEQISDCEEGELDESGEHSDVDLPRSGNKRIVRMVSPPAPQMSLQAGAKDGNDCEEDGEIVDKKKSDRKKSKSKKRKTGAEAEDAAETATAVNTEDCELLRSAGIGGERKVEMSLEGEGIPSTFKKLTGKTRHYRHQGDIKVVEGHGEILVKSEKEQLDEAKRAKRQEVKRYDVRRVVEERSRKDRHHRSTVKTEKLSSSSSKHKTRRKHRSSSSSSSRSSSSSSSSASSFSSSQSRERRKGKESQRKRSRSSSSESRRRRKSSGKVKSKEKLRSESKSGKDKKKKSKKKKKTREKHREKAKTGKPATKSGQLDGEMMGNDPRGDEEDIEIPSKAVFASGDKIVVSLHFGSGGGGNGGGSSGHKSAAKKKKRKPDVSSKDHHHHSSNKRAKEEEEDSPPSPTRAPTPSAEPTNKKAQRPKSEPRSPPRRSTSPDGIKNTPDSKETTEGAAVSSSKSNEAPRPRDPMPASLRGRGRGRVPRIRPARGKPVLIDIETSEVIPLEDNRPSDVIVLSDSDGNSEPESKGSPVLPPLPPLPPPKKPSPGPTPQKAPNVKAPMVIRGKKPMLAGVKFSLSSKAQALKKLNNPLALMAEAEEEEDQTQEDDPPAQPQLAASPLPTAEASPAIDATTNAPAVGTGMTTSEEATFLANLPLPEGPTSSASRRSNSPAKTPSSSTVATHRSGTPTAKRAASPTKSAGRSSSPIFRPSTLPPPPPHPPSSQSGAETSSYDPSNPTHTPSSGSSTPSPSPSPQPPPPPAVASKQKPPPPLPPPPTPPMMASFPPLHPGAVLMPPMMSLPPPPLPPAPLLTAGPFAVLPSGYNPAYPPPAIGLLPLPAGLLSLNHHRAPPPVVKAPPPVAPPQPPPPAATVPTPPAKASGRPMTPPSPTPSEGSDIFGPPSGSPSSPISDYEPEMTSSSSTKPRPPASGASKSVSGSSSFDMLLQSSSSSQRQPTASSGKSGKRPSPSKSASKSSSSKPAPPQISLDGLEECPSSAVDLQVKEKFLKKLNRQERVVEEVRLALKPYYTSKRISKSDYKEILRKCVPKICHTKSGEINPIKIKEMVKAYVKKFRYHHKKDVSVTNN